MDFLAFVIGGFLTDRMSSSFFYSLTSSISPAWCNCKKDLTDVIRSVTHILITCLISGEIAGLSGKLGESQWGTVMAEIENPICQEARAVKDACFELICWSSSIDSFARNSV